MRFPIKPLQTRQHNPVTKLYTSQAVKNSGNSQPHRYPDVILISTNDDFQSDNTDLLHQAQHFGLDVETVMMETKNGSDLRKKIQQLHRQHRLGPDTQVLISLHGVVDKRGVHRLSGNRDNFMVTTRLLGLLRKPPPGCPPQKWNGNIHINACKIGLIREKLNRMEGTYFLYGGKKSTLIIDGTETFLNLLRLIGESKKTKIEDQTYPGISAEELFYEAANFSGETVSLHKDKNSWVSNATVPKTGNLKISKQQIILQAQRSIRTRLLNSKTEKVKIILDRSDKNLVNMFLDGSAPIHEAAYSEINRLEKINLLLEAGAYINAKDEFGDTALMIAARNDDYELIETLLHAGADPDIANEKGFRPIHVVIKNGNIQSLELLLKNGSKINSLDERVIEPIFYAIENKNEQVILALLEHGKIDFEMEDENGDHVFAAACKTLSEDVIVKMLMLGADPLDADWNNITPLEIAVKNNDARLVFAMLTTPKVIWPGDALVKKIISINNKIKNEGMTLLFKKLQEISAILKNSKLINEPESNGLTPLQEAATNENWLKAELLIKAGANVDLDPTNSGTPLMFFAENGDASLVDLLLMYGANTAKENKEGKTAIDLARENGHKKIVKLLEGALV